MPRITVYSMETCWDTPESCGPWKPWMFAKQSVRVMAERARVAVVS